MTRKQISEETRKKLSDAKKGSNNPNYMKYGVNHPKYGTHLSEDTKKRISMAMSGRTVSAETRKKISEGMKGYRKYLLEDRGEYSPLNKSEPDENYDFWDCISTEETEDNQNGNI